MPRLKALLLTALGQVYHQEDDLVLGPQDFSAQLSTLSVGQVSRSYAYGIWMGQLLISLGKLV